MVYILDVFSTTMWGSLVDSYSGSQSAVRLSPRAKVCKKSSPSPPKDWNIKFCVGWNLCFYHIWWNKHPLTSRFRVPRVLTPQIHDADWLMKLSTVLLCAWHCSPGSLLCLRLFCTLKNVCDTVVDFSRVLGTVPKPPSWTAKSHPSSHPSGVRTVKS